MGQNASNNPFLIICFYNLLSNKNNLILIFKLKILKYEYLCNSNSLHLHKFSSKTKGLIWTKQKEQK